MSDSEHRALEALDEHALVERLQTLVRVPSVSGSPEEVSVQEVAAEMLTDLGMRTDLWEIDLEELLADPWFPGAEVERERALGLVATTGPDEGQPALALQGHLDVVPVGDVTAWHGMDPFSAELREGSVYGRGALDMKAGFAANLAVVQALRDAGVELLRPLAVHAVTGEEDGGLGAFATLRRGHRADAAVITEPTDGRMVLACAGALTFRVEVPGLSAHGSLRGQGVSAVEKWRVVHDALLDLETARNVDVDPLFVRTLPYALSIGVLHAGEWSSSVPDRLVAEGRYGVRLGEDPVVARSAFERTVYDACAGDPWLSQHPVQIVWPGGQFASGRTDPGHPFVGELAHAIRDETSREPQQVAEVYGSDLRLYTGIGGIPTAHYGPGDPLLAHAPLERVPVEQVVEVARSLTRLAVRRCCA